jgi:ATP-dependent Zn protease
LIESQYQRAVQILQENKDKLNQLADILIEKEVIFKDDLEAIFGKRTLIEPTRRDRTVAKGYYILFIKKS